ncbi:hypothetical protein F5Y12DRAFT_713213 [Xylaria sp. FL1777]|nr:hypothetical protein F5Y12DRAFT_713213 [Xylaria sp. FL1777]
MAQHGLEMASRSERAYTCRLPTRNDTSFLRPISPDWAKIDIIGQTIILAELTSHFGSFQNTCRALKLQSNEIESFLLTHLQYQEACKRGKLVVEQWGRDQAVPINETEDIPQQRPVLILPSSIEPACDFLKAMGYQDHVQAVQAWNRRTITWPPHIDVTGVDISRLDQADVIFPPPREQKSYSKYTTCVGNDTRAMVALVGAWRPRADGTPDARISFIDLPEGSVAYGPRGPRQLTTSGRYYVCWSTRSPTDNEYNDFVLARNASDIREDKNSRLESLGSRGYQSNNVSAASTQSDSEESRHAKLEILQTDQGPLMARLDSSANPKNIFGSDEPDAHSIRQENAGPFHSLTEPQGPSRELANPELQQLWNTWPGEIFQFRLPRSYTILGPQGHVLTFDPPQHERYDDLGDAHGIGGTYFVVPPPKTSEPATFNMGDLPAHIALRLKTTQRLVIIRNGMVLPHFVEPGVHEWSIREGYLDFYGAHGCYAVLQTEGRYSILPDDTTNSLEQLAHQGNGQGNRQGEEHEDEEMEYSRAVAADSSPTSDALKISAPHRSWLDRHEDETQRPEGKYEDVTEEPEVQAIEREMDDVIVLEDTATAQCAQNRRVRKKQSSDGQPYPNLSNAPTSNLQYEHTQHREQQKPIDLSAIVEPDATAYEEAPPRRGRGPGVRRSKRMGGDEDEDYTPARSGARRGRKRARGGGASKSTSAPKGRKPQATPAKAGTGKKGRGRASTRTHESASDLTESRPPLTAVNRKPIGLLDAIQVDENGGDTAVYLPTLPGAKGWDTAANGGVANGPDKMTPGTGTAKPHDPDETESEKEH